MLRQLFWLIDLAVVLMFAFFLALGAFGVGDVGWVTVAVSVLALAYVAHVILLRRGEHGHHEAYTARDRERRGF